MKLTILHCLLLLFCSNFAVSAAELSPEITQKILERFPQADRDGDGTLSKAETAMVQKMIIKKYPKADADGDGQLSKAEQMKLAKAMKGKRQPKGGKGPKAAQPSSLPEATHANVKYGDHERHILDVWIADAAVKQPTPLALYIHGGGFGSGSKAKLSAKERDELLEAGVSVAAVNYRYKSTHPLPAAHHDCKQALQFIRAKAGEWNLDKEKVAVWGSSAGAQLSMWLAYSDDMADTSSENPIERESTRVTCVATKGGQTTMDEAFWTKLVDGFGGPGSFDPQPRLAIFGAKTLEEANKTALSVSALELISSDDPPIFMSYSMEPTAKPPALDGPKIQGWVVHHVNFGTALKKKAESLKVESHLVHPGTTPKYQSHVEFMVDKLTE